MGSSSVYILVQIDITALFKGQGGGILVDISWPRKPKSGHVWNGIGVIWCSEVFSRVIDKVM